KLHSDGVGLCEGLCHRMQSAELDAQGLALDVDLDAAPGLALVDAGIGLARTGEGPLPARAVGAILLYALDAAAALGVGLAQGCIEASVGITSAEDTIVRIVRDAVDDGLAGRAIVGERGDADPGFRDVGHMRRETGEAAEVMVHRRVVVGADVPTEPVRFARIAGELAVLLGKALARGGDDFRLNNLRTADPSI